MNLTNATKMQADYTLGVDPSAREHIVVVVKGTFDFPERGKEPSLAEEQVPLVVADTFTNEPGKSAPVYESDFPLNKPLCDVLLNGCAYAPGGKPTTKVQVGMKVGAVAKVFNVVGDRTWQSRGMTVIAGPPKPFTVMPISYDRAFGGVDEMHPDPKNHGAYMPNPVGRGFHKQTAAEFVDAKPLPNTEESNSQVTSPTGRFRPMSFGPVGRGWEPRYKLAGSYDDDWLAEVFPFLPADFDDAYYQAAPTDQQMPYPKGGEDVVLLNLTPEGRASFRLPVVEIPIELTKDSFERIKMWARLDTVLLEPDAKRMQLTWRASHPLQRDIFELLAVIVGAPTRGWTHARDVGKRYFPGIGAMVRALKQEGGEL